MSAPQHNAPTNWRWRCHTHGVNGWRLAANRCCPDAVRYRATAQEGGPPNDVEIDLDAVRDEYDAHAPGGVLRPGESLSASRPEPLLTDEQHAALAEDLAAVHACPPGECGSGSAAGCAAEVPAAGPEAQRVYVAGPMRGYPDFNAPAFRGAAKRLRAAGHEVFCPTERDDDHGFTPDGRALTGTEAELAAAGFDLRRALGDDLAWITRCADAVIVLPGWQKSRGAKAEAATAMALGLPVWELDAFLAWGMTARPAPADDDPAADPEAPDYAQIAAVNHGLYKSAEADVGALCTQLRQLAAELEDEAARSARAGTAYGEGESVALRAARRSVLRIAEAEAHAATPPARPADGYRLTLTYTAADDHQAARLGMAWAQTCAAEYGTRDAVVQRADGTVLAGEDDTPREPGRSADEVRVQGDIDYVLEHYGVTDLHNADEIRYRLRAIFGPLIAERDSIGHRMREAQSERDEARAALDRMREKFLAALASDEADEQRQRAERALTDLKREIQRGMASDAERDATIARVRESLVAVSERMTEEHAERRGERVFLNEYGRGMRDVIDELDAALGDTDGGA